jgi:hypothetical protein
MNSIVTARHSLRHLITSTQHHVPRVYFDVIVVSAT